MINRRFRKTNVLIRLIAILVIECFVVTNLGFDYIDSIKITAILGNDYSDNSIRSLAGLPPCTIMMQDKSPLKADSRQLKPAFSQEAPDCLSPPLATGRQGENRGTEHLFGEIEREELERFLDSGDIIQPDGKPSFLHIVWQLKSALQDSSEAVIKLLRFYRDVIEGDNVPAGKTMNRRETAVNVFRKLDRKERIKLLEIVDEDSELREADCIVEMKRVNEQQLRIAEAIEDGRMEKVLRDLGRIWSNPTSIKSYDLSGSLVMFMVETDEGTKRKLLLEYIQRLREFLESITDGRINLVESDGLTEEEATAFREFIKHVRAVAKDEESYNSDKASKVLSNLHIVGRLLDLNWGGMALVAYQRHMGDEVLAWVSEAHYLAQVYVGHVSTSSRDAIEYRTASTAENPEGMPIIWRHICESKEDIPLMVNPRRFDRGEGQKLKSTSLSFVNKVRIPWVEYLKEKGQWRFIPADEFLSAGKWGNSDEKVQGSSKVQTPLVILDYDKNGNELVQHVRLEQPFSLEYNDGLVTTALPKPQEFSDEEVAKYIETGAHMRTSVHINRKDVGASIPWQHVKTCGREPTIENESREYFYRREKVKIGWLPNYDILTFVIEGESLEDLKEILAEVKKLWEFLYDMPNISGDIVTNLLGSNKPVRIYLFALDIKFLYGENPGEVTSKERQTLHLPSGYPPVQRLASYELSKTFILSKKSELITKEMLSVIYGQLGQKKHMMDTVFEKVKNLFIDTQQTNRLPQAETTAQKAEDLVFSSSKLVVPQTEAADKKEIQASRFSALSSIAIQGQDSQILIPTDIICRTLQNYENIFPEGVADNVIADLKKVGNTPISITEIKHLFSETEEASHKRVVFTGAPYAGKTTFLKAVKERYGGAVAYLPEIIGSLVEAGIQLDDDVNAQRLIYILKYLLEREASILYPEQIILCDRGTIDCVAYWPGGIGQFEAEIGSIQKEYKRYEAVVMLQTVASLNPQELRNRKEDSTRAVEIEKILRDTWKNHRRFYFVEHKEWFLKTSTLDRMFSFLFYNIQNGNKAPPALEVTLDGKRFRLPTIEAYRFNENEVQEFFGDSASKSNIPLVIDINFVAPCQAKCIYCFTESGSMARNAEFKADRFHVDERIRPLNREETKEIIKQYAELGGKVVFICSDGEPLARPKEFFEYAEIAKQHGLRVVVYTNMLGITKDIARRLHEGDVNVVLKLEHLNPEQNDAIIRPRNGGFRYIEYLGEWVPEQLATVLEEYRDSPDKLALCSMITAKNVDNLLELRRWAYEKLGIAHFIKKVYWYGFAEEYRKDLELTPEKERRFEQEVYEFDKQYGFEYPRGLHDEYSFDIRRFLNNALNRDGFPVRIFFHIRGGFYHSSDAVKPKFGFNEGVKTGLRDLTNNRINLKMFFDEIYNHVKFYKETQELIARNRSILEETEQSFWDDKTKGINIEQGMPQRNKRRDAAYKVSRELGKYLRTYSQRLERRQGQELEELFGKAKKLARENSLFFLPVSPGIFLVKKNWLRIAYPKGEEFIFFSLHRANPFYIAPYQVTYSITPPGHKQVIHGHFRTRELTVSLGRGMFFEVFKFKNGEIIQKDKVTVDRFVGTGYGINTPHLIGNEGRESCKNITVKYGDAVIDRWDLEENPNEDEYTYVSGVVYPEAKQEDGVTTYSFEKENLFYRILVIPPRKSLLIPFGDNNERGLFVVEGTPMASYGNSKIKASEGDIIYAIREKDGIVPVVFNNTDKEIVLFVVDLKDKSLERFGSAKEIKFQALLVDVDGVLTDPQTKEIVPEVMERLIQILEKEVPVCLASGRKMKTTMEERTRGIKCMEDIAEVIRKTLRDKGREDLLGNLFIASENGAIISNGYNDTDSRKKYYSTGVSLDAISPSCQDAILQRLDSYGLLSGLMTERKEYSLAIVNIPKAKMDEVKAVITNELARQGKLQKSDMIITDKGIYLYPRGTSKKLALRFLMRKFSIRDGEIAAFSDEGERNGVDNVILDRIGGFSVEKYDLKSEYMIDIPTISGCEPGYKAFLWAIDVLNFTKLTEDYLPVFRNFGSTGLKFFIIGAGSIWLGRQWPPDNVSYIYPEFEEVSNYLDEVFTRIGNEEGVVMIDTAPAYGFSEERIGEYFRRRKELLPKVFIATKWGAEFDIFTGISTLDHSKAHLVASVNRSLLRLGKIDLLYIHGTSLEVLRDKEIIYEMKNMKEQHYGGIQYIGASMSDERVLETAVEEDLIEDLDVIQMPVPLFLKRKDLVSEIYKKGIAIVLNSPIKKGGDKSPEEIYADLVRHEEVSVILTGTRHHLEETIGYIENRDL